MLVGYFAGVKLNDTHQHELDPSTGGSHNRKHPIHIERVRKVDHEFFDDPIVAKGLRQRVKVEIWRNVRQKVTGIELAHSYPTHPALPGRNGKHIRIFGHRSEGRIGAFEHEFCVGVLLPTANIVCW